jgi:hypothetical protein
VLVGSSDAETSMIADEVLVCSVKKGPKVELLNRWRCPLGS